MKKFEMSKEIKELINEIDVSESNYEKHQTGIRQLQTI